MSTSLEAFLKCLKLTPKLPFVRLVQDLLWLMPQTSEVHALRLNLMVTELFTHMSCHFCALHYGLSFLEYYFIT